MLSVYLCRVHGIFSMAFEIFTLNERPELRSRIFAAAFQPPFFPEFMVHDRTAKLYFCLFGYAKSLVRHAAEAAKPDEARLREYTDVNFLTQRQIRATGTEPLRLPDSWISARDALDLGLPFNFATTNDTIGGNSGSPVINKDAEVVGLIFDGNIQSLGGEFGFDPEQNRAVAVAVGALREALTKIYHADRIVEELTR
jgi:Peptidase S46